MRSTDLGDTLCIWAHPDDETYLGGGIMAALRDAGHRVVCVTATRGELGGQAPPDELAETRTKELDAALGVLGVDEHHWLDLPDGGLADVDPPIDALARLIREVRPRTVLTFAPDGMTGHPDHQAVSRWAHEALDQWGCAGPQLLLATMTPEDLAASADVDARLGVVVGDPPEATPEEELALRVVLDGADLERKVAALTALDSQTRVFRDALGPDGYRAWVRTESFRLA